MKTKECRDSDEGMDYLVKGALSGSGSWDTAAAASYGYTEDHCSATGKAVEMFCIDDTYKYFTSMDCTTRYGSYSFCDDGACVVVDFAAKDLSVSYDEDVLRVTIEIENKGVEAASVGSYVVIVTAPYAVTVPVWIKDETFSSTLSIGAGTMEFLSTELDVDDAWLAELEDNPQDIEVQVFVDSEYDTNEFDETNNVFSKIINVGG